MIGNSIFDYMHDDDVDRWQHACKRQTMPIDYVLDECRQYDMLTIRMRSTLTKRIKKEMCKCFSGYKVVYHVKKMNDIIINAR